MRVIRGFIWTLLGGFLVGFVANRLVAFIVDHPLVVGVKYTLEDYIAAMAGFPALDHRFDAVFWAGFGIIALTCMGTYDWTGEKKRRRELKGQEYGDSRWARVDEMDEFAHTGTVRKVPIRVPQRFTDAVRFAVRNPKQYLMSKLSLREKKADPKPSYVERLEDDNVILSEQSRLQLSKIPDPNLERNKHFFVLGGSGSGKTFNFVGPNLLQLFGSYVITDPKGDTLKQYGNFFLKHGYKLKVVNTKPSEISDSMHYNPFVYLTNTTSIMQVTNLFIENTSGDSSQPHSNEDFFVKAERQVYMALMGYLFFFYADQPQYQTFPELLDLLQLSEKANPNQAKSPLDIIMLGTTEADGFEGFEEWLCRKYGSLEAAQASEEYFVIKQYKGFKSTAGSPETEASVIASCNVRLAPFAVAAVRSFFSDDELELGRIGEERTAFFLVMSDTDSTFNFILAMLLYQLFDINTAQADRNPGSHCSIPVMCILDEFANIGRIPDMDVKIATLRSRWIDLVPILQSTAQLKGMYDKKADIIEGNCDTTVFLGRCDQETNKQISERLGKYTIVVNNRSESHGRQGSWSESENRVAKELLSPADLGSNPEKFAGDDCIVMIKNAHPFLDKKYRTIDHPRYHELRECGEFVLEDWNFDRREEKRLADARLEREVTERRRIALATFDSC